MAKYKISESVSGTIVILPAKDPIKALEKYIKGHVVANPDSGSWSFDFEIEDVTKMKEIEL